MRLVFLALTISVISFFLQARAETKVISLHARLSLYGTEDFYGPEIEAFIDFKNDSGLCKITYEDPRKKDSAYHFSNIEIQTVFDQLNQVDLDTLKTEYKARMTDQATSYITISTPGKQYNIKDYGLIGDHPLQKIYRIIYSTRYQ
ncbi:MAG: hypothetical protein DI535_29355 [Citrobacter freundii]|nr:MAG: hypothetical protein DI535_29355 [Citrobacter freundii]